MRVLAYLDANSGSLIASAVAGGLAGVAVVFKMGRARLAMMFSPRRRREAAAERAAETE